MDLKGQQLSERTFMGFMWTITILSAVLTFIFDDVTVMFKTFAGGLALSALVRIASLDSPHPNANMNAFQSNLHVVHAATLSCAF